MKRIRFYFIRLLLTKEEKNHIQESLLDQSRRLNSSLGETLQELAKEKRDIINLLN